jgi:uncharacterized membrane protein
VEGLEIGLLYSNSHWEVDALENIVNQFEIVKIKTPQQDLEFSIYQMVEIALRTISPGINNPLTAIACIDNLTAVMSYLAQAKFPSKYLFDEKENLRIVADILDAAFN